MKNVIYLALALITLPAFAQNPEQPKVEVKQVSHTKEEFLSFILEKAKDYTEKGEQAIGKAVDAVTSETPDIMRQFIVWRACMHGIKFFAALIVIGIIIVTYYKVVRFLWRQEGYDAEMGAPMFAVLGGGAGLAGIIIMGTVFINNLLPFVQCLVAPKIYIIEQVINLVQK
jgi:hypothetical protein